EHRLGEVLDVVRDDVIAPVRGRPCLGGPDQPEGAADADADGDVLRAPRLGDDPGDVVEDRGVDVDGAGELDHVDDGRAGDDGGDGGGPVPGGGAGEDAHGGVVVRVTDRGLHEETVELGLRQPVGAGLLHRVLGGDDEEGAPDVVRDAVEGHPPFLHDLQQRGLRLGRGPVDLVGEDDGG